ncbi:hypothetical protein EDB83DRAFT_2404543 [Lactarius deliciosus]|nr:hypothetical protein EDB83DRAFT_2404543 [Lactarius deliciosus]
MPLPSLLPCGTRSCHSCPHPVAAAASVGTDIAVLIFAVVVIAPPWSFSPPSSHAVIALTIAPLWSWCGRHRCHLAAIAVAVILLPSLLALRSAVAASFMDLWRHQPLSVAVAVAWLEVHDGSTVVSLNRILFKGGEAL